MAVRPLWAMSATGGGSMKKSDANPMQRAHDAPRCAARSKRSRLLCKNPAVKGWRVCRMHGAGGGHGPGKVNPAYKHGMRSREWIEVRREIGEVGRDLDV